MNERIQKLRKQAWYYADDNSRDGDDGKHGQLYAEKFAELIVRECADRIDDLVTCDGDGNQILDCDDVRTELLEHFGVEE